MNSVVTELENLEETLAVLACDVFESEAIPELSDADVVALLAVTGRLQRRLEGLQVEAVVQVRERSEGMRDERLTTTYGCTRPADLIRMTTLTDSRSASRLVKAAGLVRRERSITDGGFLPARYPALRDAVMSGDLGLDGCLAATDPLEGSARRIADDARLEADRQLGAFARGIDPDHHTNADAGVTDDTDQGPLPTPEEVRILSRVLVAYLDPDGAEPADEVAMRGRGFTIDPVRNGLRRAHGGLLPEIAAQLELLLDSLMNPRIDGPPQPGVHFYPIDSTDTDTDTHSDTDAHADADADADADVYGSGEHDLPDPAVLDTRTPAQKRHDALATILTVAARAGTLPDLGGAAPTLVVTATAEDLLHGSGHATVANTGDLVPLFVATQTGCAGGIQRILFDENGRIAALSTTGRIFNALQRRAITARDGGCVIPGCTIPATWCEVHHVQEHAHDGPTHTDNGTLLCWFHHRTLHLSHWQIRMNNGTPEIRGPAWWDPHRQWRPTGKRRPTGRRPPGTRARPSTRARPRRRQPA